jgi:hypothetical protein
MLVVLINIILTINLFCEWELGIGNWELGIGNWELGIGKDLLQLTATSLISLIPPFPISHSQFSIPHSQFSIPRFVNRE